MENYSQVSVLIFAAYVDTGMFKYLYFLIIMTLYVSIVASNLLLMVVICVNRSLHKPMYVFLCSLFVNELYGSAGMFPFLLLQILADVHTISLSHCFLQMFFLFSYVCVEFASLAIMSYDRYLAICFPLQYNTVLTYKKVTVLITVSWVFAYILIVIPTSLSASLHLCGNVIDKVYCDNYSIVKLACSDTTVNNIYGLIGTTVAVLVPLSLILYSYTRILKVCFSGSKQTRHKALTTCTPHLASLLNFSFGCFFEIIQSRFNMQNVPHMLRIFLSMYFLTCQPLFNPLMYGLKLSNIHTACRNVFCVTGRIQSRRKISASLF